MTDETKRACTTCLLCLREDYGYSNYTTEGTTLGCLAGLNPALDGMEDEWRPDLSPAMAVALDVALTCPRYREGAPATLDVDQEGIDSGSYQHGEGWVRKDVTPESIIAGGYTDDREAAELLAARFNTE